MSMQEKSKYLKRSEWTNMLIIAIPSESWSEEQKKKYDMQEEAGFKPAAPKRASGPPDAALANKKPRTTTSSSSPPTKAELESSTEQVLWRRLTAMKARITKATTGASQLERLASSEAGRWMSRLDEFDCMIKKRNLLEEKLQKNSFWSEMMDDGATMRKSLTKGQIEAEVVASNDFGEDCDSLQSDVDTIHRLRRAKAIKK